MECTLSDDGLGRRLDWIRREILPHAVEAARQPEGLALELEAAPGLAERIDRWIALERECCAGLVFERRASATPGRLRVEIRGIDPDASLFRELVRRAPAEPASRGSRC